MHHFNYHIILCKYDSESGRSYRRKSSKTFVGKGFCNTKLYNKKKKCVNRNINKEFEMLVKETGICLEAESMMEMLLSTCMIPHLK
jgi:hypothetical protein